MILLVFIVAICFDGDRPNFKALMGRDVNFLLLTVVSVAKNASTFSDWIVMYLGAGPSFIDLR